MEYQRSDRVADLLMEVIAELFRREIHDPRLRWVNLTTVRVSKDLRRAKVYFTILGDGGLKDDVVAGLKSASGFIRSKAGKQLGLRFVPLIDFIYDDSADEAQRIEALLHKVKD
jgi:ribosome-binding factor A